MTEEPILFTQKWHQTKGFIPLFFVYIFIFIIAPNFVLPQPSAPDCVLNLEPSSPSYNSSCDEGDWGGFLHRNCCGEAFRGYLFALGQRANKTGKIFLNPSEQGNCLTSMKNYEEDIFGCGIEQLTSGSGGCSDYSVADVTKRFRDELRSLDENCKLGSSGGAWDQSCLSCVKRWEEIKTSHSISNNSGTMTVETDMCRFAVLVSLTSARIEDETVVKAIYRCLGGQKISTGNEVPEGKRKGNIRTEIWILIGGAIGVTVMVIMATCILSRRSFKSNPSSKRHVKEVLQREPDCPKFRSREVYSATNNLNELNIIGEGTAGKVYKGILSNNQHVAIKHITNDVNVETFVREVTSVSHVKHPNLVALLGCCLKKEECFLVYELCPNGNLSEWLFGKDKVLTWIQRLEIAIDSARGLRYLHTYPEGCIVHRDIKPTNILLGENFEAKLSDFGLSKVIDLGETYASSEVRGTFGYVDPEYQSNHRVNSSGDVYSFGIVLLQIISGKKVVNLNLKIPIPLNKMAKALTRGGSIVEFADPKLGGNYSVEAFDLTLQLALSCTALNQQRPSMEQVVIKLQEALNISTAKASNPNTTPDQQHLTL